MDEKEKNDFEKRMKNLMKRKGKRVGSTNMKKERKTKHFLKEFEYISINESSVTTQLRTEHIPLNSYTNVIYEKNCQTSPNCDKCKKKETVKHFLLECKKYKKQRKELIENLKLIIKNFRMKKHFNIKYLLFNYNFQKNPNEKENILQRIKILQCICKYVWKTNRFNNELIKTKIFKNLGKEYGNERRKEIDEFENDIDEINDIIESNNILEEKNGDPILLQI